MSRSVFDPTYDALPETLPIFPLTGALLLPGGRLPLNIFEPRYLAMISDALASDRLIGMVQPRDEGAEAPEIYDIGCAGRLISFAETDDGRYLITLQGLIRFGWEQELPLYQGYRRVMPLYDRFVADLEEDEEEIDRSSLLDALRGYFDATGLDGDWDTIEKAPNEHLVTSLSMGCPFAPPEKQALLEALTLGERSEVMTAILKMSTHAARGPVIGN